MFNISEAKKTIQFSFVLYFIVLQTCYVFLCLCNLFIWLFSLELLKYWLSINIIVILSIIKNNNQFRAQNGILEQEAIFHVLYTNTENSQILSHLVAGYVTSQQYVLLARFLRRKAWHTIFFFFFFYCKIIVWNVGGGGGSPRAKENFRVDVFILGPWIRHKV